MRHMPAVGALCFFACLLAACATPRSETAVASLSERDVERQDVESWLEAATPGERANALADAQSLGDFVRGQLFTWLLVEEARLTGIDQSPEFRALEESLTRQAMWALSREQFRPTDIPVPTEDELRDAWEQSRRRFFTPARRDVVHIFRRFGGAEREAAIESLEEARLQTLAGADFTKLARELTDSELRLTGGQMGWITRDQLPQELSDLIFGLTPGEPSAVVRTVDGAHLFLVRQAEPEQLIAFADARNTLLNELRSARINEAFDRFLAEYASEDDYLVTQEQLRALLEAQRLTEQVLRMDGSTVTLGQLIGGRPPAGGELELLSRLGYERQSRLALRWAQSEGVAQADVDRELLSRRLERALANRVLETRVRAETDSREVELLSFYRENERRFARPITVDFARLVVPLGDEPSTTARALAKLGERQRLTTEALETSAAQLGGTVHLHEGERLVDVLRTHPKLAPRLEILAPGDSTDSYRTEQGIEMALLIDRSEPVPMDFASVRSQVVNLYLERERPAIVQRVREETLDEAGFQLHLEATQELYDALRPPAEEANDPPGD